MVIHRIFDKYAPTWLQAKAQIQRLIDRYPGYAPYGVSDIEQELTNGDYLFIEFPDAFLVVEEDREYLHGVFAAGFDGHVAGFAQYAKAVHEMALDAGFEGFTFTTPRQGWQKTAPLAGFKVLHTEVTYIYGPEETESH